MGTSAGSIGGAIVVNNTVPFRVSPTVRASGEIFFSNRSSNQAKATITSSYYGTNNDLLIMVDLSPTLTANTAYFINATIGYIEASAEL